MLTTVHCVDCSKFYSWPNLTLFSIRLYNYRYAPCSPKTRPLNSPIDKVTTWKRYIARSSLLTDASFILRSFIYKTTRLQASVLYTTLKGVWSSDVNITYEYYHQLYNYGGSMTPTILIVIWRLNIIVRIFNDVRLYHWHCAHNKYACMKMMLRLENRTTYGMNFDWF